IGGLTSKPTLEPTLPKSEVKDTRIDMAIYTSFIGWIVVARSADWNPVQFLSFAFVYRIFEKLKAFGPRVSAIIIEEGEDEGRLMRMGKRQLLFHASLKGLSKDDLGPWNELCGERIKDAHKKAFEQSLTQNHGLSLARDIVRFHVIRKRTYSVIVQPTADTILLHVPESVTDVARNPNLQSYILLLFHYYIPVASLTLSCSAATAFVLTAVVANLLTISTVSLQNRRTFATLSPLLPLGPARIMPPRCDICKIFGHVHDYFPKKVVSPPIVATSNVVTQMPENQMMVSKRWGKKKERKGTTYAVIHLNNRAPYVEDVCICAKWCWKMGSSWEDIMLNEKSKNESKVTIVTVNRLAKKGLGCDFLMIVLDFVLYVTRGG
ncbi:chloroplast J-like domain protein 1, partial [Tanacetum coccineum]